MIKLTLILNHVTMIKTLDMIGNMITKSQDSSMFDSPYLLYRMANTDHYYCGIHEILYDDLMSAELDWIIYVYNKLVSTFGQEMMDRLVPKDPSSILDRLNTMLSKSLEHTFNGECLLDIRFNEVNNLKDPTILPNHILTMIHEYFDVIDLDGGQYIVKKRGNSDGNIDAN